MGPGGIQPGNYSNGSLTQSQQQWLWQYFGHTGNVPAGYNGENVTNETSNYTPGETATQIAQQNLAGQNQIAEGTLAATGASMAQAYQQLLASVTGQGQYGINTATSSEEALLAKEGVSGLAGDTALTQAQMEAETTAATNEGNVQTAGAQAQAGIAGSIAALISGNAGTVADYGLNAGSLAQNLAIQELPYTQVPATGISVPASNALLVPKTVGDSIQFEGNGKTVVSNSKGGVLPGYAPGVDDIRAKLSPGEGVLTPEAVKLIGADKINWINKIAMKMSGRDTSGQGGGGDPSSSGESVRKALEILSSMSGSSRKPQASMSRFVH